LRLAIELRVLGHKVYVLEKRAGFSRINRVHLWDWCKHDLISLGAKIFGVPGSSFGANADYCHIGICELQSMLLKVCLLMGVEFHLGSEFLGAEDDRVGTSGWQAKVQAASGQISWLPFDVLVGSDGANSIVPRQCGVADELGRMEMGLKKNSAIGLVANFIGHAPSNLRQFSWARQFAGEKFAALEQQAGVSLENIVYYRSGTQHYVVMTPTPESLASKGVVKDPDVPNIVQSKNIDPVKLRSFAAAAVAHFGLPLLEFAKAPNDASLFDFSDTSRARQSCAFLESAESSPGMVALVGDALLEPFWPEGLGIMRGFLSAMDAAAAIGAWSRGDVEKAKQISSQTFTTLKSLNGQTATRILQGDITKYSTDPASRYR
jgi:2-polyprenyl-6-methoxyphenol hydroxylase-like FAD-dependent oxidoreductase